MYSIGTLSKRTGVKVATIRYYEQMGLIAPPERTSGNQRRYDEEGMRRLSFIRHSRQLGFSIEDIQGLLTLAQHPETPCEGVDQITRKHLDAVREKIAKLKKLEAELQRVSTCDAGQIGNCLVIETLADHGLCNGAH